MDVNLTGIVSTGCIPADGGIHGTMLSKELYAPSHQHFVARLDMAVDGIEQNILEVECLSDEIGPANAPGNGFFS